MSRFRRLPTEIEEVALIEPTIHGDERGFFVETFRANELADLGIGLDFVQENHSRSAGQVLRGIQEEFDSRPEELNEVTVRPLDAYGALAYLRSRPDVIAARIGLQGWSNGGSAAISTIAVDAPGIRTCFPSRSRT